MWENVARGSAGGGRSGGGGNSGDAKIDSAKKLRFRDNLNDNSVRCVAELTVSHALSEDHDYEFVETSAKRFLSRGESPFSILIALLLLPPILCKLTLHVKYSRVYLIFLKHCSLKFLALGLFDFLICLITICQNYTISNALKAKIDMDRWLLVSNGLYGCSTFPSEAAVLER